jgi:hypothetical protein
MLSDYFETSVFDTKTEEEVLLRVRIYGEPADYGSGQSAWWQVEEITREDGKDVSLSQFSLWLNKVEQDYLKVIEARKEGAAADRWEDR